jgi:hypothetical protein
MGINDSEKKTTELLLRFWQLLIQLQYKIVTPLERVEHFGSKTIPTSTCTKYGLEWNLILFKSNPNILTSLGVPYLQLQEQFRMLL